MLAEAVARERGIGWMSTDTIRDIVAMLRPELYEVAAPGEPHDPEADLFFPYLERVAESCSYLVDEYLIEGVGFMRCARCSGGRVTGRPVTSLCWRTAAPDNETHRFAADFYGMSPWIRIVAVAVGALTLLGVTASPAGSTVLRSRRSTRHTAFATSRSCRRADVGRGRRPGAG